MIAARSTAAEHAAADVRRTVRQVAVDVYAAMAGDQPIPGMAVAARPMLDDPLAGVRAADLVHRVALTQVREWAEAARGAGRSWDDVADALGLADDTDEFGPTRGAAAFDWLIDGRPPADTDAAPSFRTPTTRWTCTDCGQRVTDSGPCEPHPDDREHGHAPDCTRQQAARDAYRREWDQ